VLIIILKLVLKLISMLIVINHFIFTWGFWEKEDNEPLYSTIFDFSPQIMVFYCNLISSIHILFVSFYCLYIWPCNIWCSLNLFISSFSFQFWNFLSFCNSFNIIFKSEANCSTSWKVKVSNTRKGCLRLIRNHMLYLIIYLFIYLFIIFFSL